MIFQVPTSSAEYSQQLVNPSPMNFSSFLELNKDSQNNLHHLLTSQRNTSFTPQAFKHQNIDPYCSRSIKTYKGNIAFSMSDDLCKPPSPLFNVKLEDHKPISSQKFSPLQRKLQVTDLSNVVTLSRTYPQANVRARVGPVMSQKEQIHSLYMREEEQCRYGMRNFQDDSAYQNKQILIKRENPWIKEAERLAYKVPSLNGSEYADKNIYEFGTQKKLCQETRSRSSEIKSENDDEVAYVKDKFTIRVSVSNPIDEVLKLLRKDNSTAK